MQQPIGPTPPDTKLRWRDHPFDQWRICTARVLEVDDIQYVRDHETGHVRPMIDLLLDYLPGDGDSTLWPWDLSSESWRMDHSKPPLTDDELDAWVKFGSYHDRF